MCGNSWISIFLSLSGALISFTVVVELLSCIHREYLADINFIRTPLVRARWEKLFRFNCCERRWCACLIWTILSFRQLLCTLAFFSVCWDWGKIGSQQKRKVNVEMCFQTLTIWDSANSSNYERFQGKINMFDMTVKERCSEFKSWLSETKIINIKIVATEEWTHFSLEIFSSVDLKMLDISPSAERMVEKLWLAAFNFSLLTIDRLWRIHPFFVLWVRSSSRKTFLILLKHIKISN